MQQGVRNALRGVGGERGVGVHIPGFKSTLAELDKSLTSAPVHADTTSGGLTKIEDKAKQLDQAMWSTKMLSRAEQDQLRGLRVQGARIEAVDALAYAWLKRSEIAGSVKSSNDLAARLDSAMTLSDEFRLNAELKGLVTEDWNRLQELMSYVVITNASGFMASNNNNEITKPARQSSNANIVPGAGSGDGSDTYDFASARSSCEVASRRAVWEHNHLTDVKDMQSYQPSLMRTVEEHDARKQHAWDSNSAILAVLSALYQDPTAAWNKLSAELSSMDRTSYLEQGRYAAGRAAANAIVPTLLAQSSTTRYGKRKKTPNCTQEKQDQNACLPFTTLKPSASWVTVMGDVNGYYGVGDRIYDAYIRYGGIDSSAMGQQAATLAATAERQRPEDVRLWQRQDREPADEL